jgi:hypothetical protein
MNAKPITNYLPQALLALNAVLAAANWYLHPERAGAWATVIFLLAGMSVALLAIRSSSAQDGEAARRRDEAGIRSGIVFAGLIVLVGLSAKLAVALGAGGDADLSRRGIMAILGAFLVFTGNAIPKALTPLSGVYDPARVQSFQRLAGWTWVLAGLGLAFAWLVLPIAVAERLSSILLPGAMVIIAVQALRLRRSRGRTA